MQAIIGLTISALGYIFSGIDFCTLYAFVSVALDLYKGWIDYSNDKAARR